MKARIPPLSDFGKSMMYRRAAEYPAGRELDALMWKIINGKDVTTLDCRHVDGDVQPHAGYPVGHISPPKFSTELENAWVLVKNGEWFRSLDRILAENHEYVWRCWFRVYERVFTEFVEAPTAPLAICRAALLIDWWDEFE